MVPEFYPAAPQHPIMTPGTPPQKRFPTPGLASKVAAV